MLSADEKAFLEGGCALIIGTVAGDGAPHASRGWGLDVLADGQVRLLVSQDDGEVTANLAATGAIAITAADVRTLHSVQMKGEVYSVEDGDAGDVARAQRYCDELFRDIHETDGTSYEVLARFMPSRFAVCLCRLGDRFDQTPGPGAGTEIDRVLPPTEAT